MLQGLPNTPSHLEKGDSQPETTSSTNPPKLPLLPMNLREKKKSIAITWSILILITSVSDIFLYFVLRYGAKTTTEIALTVPTAVLGAFSVLAIGFRMFQLLRKTSKSRPIGGKWWAVRYSYDQSKTMY
jgi:hypothetical protein